MIEATKKDNTILWLLGLAAIASVVFDFIKLLPLFNTYFIRDDFLFMDLGAFMRQQDPLAFLTATCIGWWRPIALLLPALGYLIFGFNPLPFHIMAYIIHLLTALLLILLCRKLFDLKIGLMAFIIYVVSPISFGDVGWMLGAMEDETATFFFFLALYTQLRLKSDEHKGPYYLPAFFVVLSSFCKITWLGLMPVLLFMDWVNYPKSAFGQRIVRCLPFLVIIPILFLNILFIGFDHLRGGIIPSYLEFFTARNLVVGSFLSFIPFDLYAYIKDHYLLMSLIPIAVFLLALLSSKGKMRVAAMGVAYLGTLAIMGLTPIQNEPLGWIMGWRHLAPLVGFAAILIALTLSGLMDRLKWRLISWLLPIVLMAALIWSGLPMKNTLRSDMETEADRYRDMMRSYVLLCRNFEPKSEIYIIAKKPLPVHLLADLASSDHQVKMLYVKKEGSRLAHNYDTRSSHVIFTCPKDMMLLIDTLVAKKVRFISTDSSGHWVDITNREKREFYEILMRQR
jgi:hypothetical protein